MAVERKQKLLEEKLLTLRDFTRPPLIASIEIHPDSIAPALLFFNFNPEEISPLVKILPHNYLKNKLEDVLSYMANKRKGTTSRYEEMFSEGLMSSLEIAKTREYGMYLCVDIGDNKFSESCCVENENRAVYYVREVREEVQNPSTLGDFRVIHYLSLNMQVYFWVYNAANKKKQVSDFFGSRKRF